VTDQNGSPVAFHDYLPFGEEIPSGIGGRTSLWGASDNVHQRFTGQQRDSETGLDYFNARYFTAPFGRFNSPDPGNAGADPTDPQTWNAYAYVRGSPLALVDPDGLASLVYDGSTNTLTVLPSWSLADPTGTTEADSGMRFCAANNVASRDTIGKLVDGSYPFLDTNSPYFHSAAEDSTDGAFGPGGIFRVESFMGADGKPHIGVGIHAGRVHVKDRAGRSGYQFATNGCIRTTDDAISYITYLAKYDPLTTLTVVNNRKAPAKPAGAAASTIRYGQPVSNGLGWSSFDLLQLLSQGGSSDAFIPAFWIGGGGIPDVSSTIKYDLQ